VPGLKTNERPGTRAVLRHHHMSASKARQVLDLIRDRDVDRAQEVLAGCERGAAEVVSKVLASAVANAVHNDGQDSEDLYVSACFADEGTTLKRWRPRARGRATRIRKRTCHITIIVSRLPEERLERRRAERAAHGSQRSRRVAESRRRADLAGRLGRRRASQEAAAAAAEAEAAEAAAAEAEAAEAEAADESEPEVAEAATETDSESEGEQATGAEDVADEAASVREASADEGDGAEPEPGDDQGKDR
jgi:large subunit ribosomal protein L22